MKPSLVPLASTLTADLVALGGPRLERRVDNAIRRGGRRVVTDAVRRFQSRAIGRSLFVGVKGRRAARTLIKATRPAPAGSGVRGVEIVAKGLAGIQETGGAIRPHVIEPKLAPVLAFAGPDGTSFARRVQHPGANVPAFPVIADAIDAQAEGIREEIEAEIDAHFSDVLGL